MNKKEKNNNLEKFREMQTNINKNLVSKAIEHIQKLNGDITFSLVSKVTFDIADPQKKEKGISLAGISKSKIYRPMIEKAKLSQQKTVDRGIKSGSKVSVGDMQMSLHSLRIQNINLKKENKILSAKLNELDVPKQEIGNINANVLKNYEDLLQVCSSLVGRLLELELAYIDLDTGTLNVSIYNEVIVPKEYLEMFYKETIDEIRNKN